MLRVCPCRKFVLTSLLAVMLIAAPGSSATSYVDLTDADLAAAAEAVALVRVVEQTPAPAGGLPATRYLVEVEEVVQGNVPGSRVEIHLPGGVSADGTHAWKVFGAPSFADGERALLFLASRQDGSYDVVELMLGAFHEVVRGGERLLLRDLSEAHRVEGDGEHQVGESSANAGVGESNAGSGVGDVDANTGAAALRSEPVRRLEEFSRWLSDRAAGVERPADYFSDLTAADLVGEVGLEHEAGLDREVGLDRVTGAYALINDGGQCDASRLPIRWFSFPVVWRMNASGQSGMAGSPGGVAEFQRALSVWNDDAGS
ncbi:MAG TPA: hypothetical protein VKU40_03090, partial [Thermoanaerobaculia bacterium]|nr:hypothetical protein [Thermoanaerobaculia bacterium]